MMKNSQKLVLFFENIRVESRLDDLSPQLLQLAVKLYDETAAWQADGLPGAPSNVSTVIDGICVMMMWGGDKAIPKVKPRVTEIFGVPVKEFLSKQY